MKAKFFTLLVSLSFLSLAPRLSACIDYTDSVRVQCDYDSTTWTSIALRVSNLRFFGGNPTHFCSCALTNYTDVFSNIQYIAFVDSGTNNVVGFEPWTPSSSAASAWDAVLATGSWNAFVAQVGAAGLFVGQRVELIIRASLPPGYYFQILDSALVLTELGTDEWNNAGSVLANSHQQILTWSQDWPATYVGHAGTSWFTQFDSELLVSIAAPAEGPHFAVAPVPAQSTLTLFLSELNQSHGLRADLLTLEGKLISSIALTGSTQEISVAELPPGMYLVRVSDGSGSTSRKFSVVH